MDHLCYFCRVFVMLLCASVYYCLVVTCWERADLLALDCDVTGAQWLSGRVLDSRPKGREFEPHRRHCVVVLEQDTSILA